MGLVALQHVGSSQPRDRTGVPCIGRQTLNHCTIREVSQAIFLMSFSGSFSLASGGLLWHGECWIFHLLGFNSIKRLKDIVMCVPWGGTRMLPRGCTIASWLFLPWFCIPSLPEFETVRICPLELRKGHGGWTERLPMPRSPYRVLLGLSSKNVTTVIGSAPNHFRFGATQLESIFAQSLTFFNMPQFIF